MAPRIPSQTVVCRSLYLFNKKECKDILKFTHQLIQNYVCNCYCQNITALFTFSTRRRWWTWAGLRSCNSIWSVGSSTSFDAITNTGTTITFLLMINICVVSAAIIPTTYSSLLISSITYVHRFTRFYERFPMWLCRLQTSIFCCYGRRLNLFQIRARILGHSDGEPCRSGQQCCFALLLAHFDLGLTKTGSYK